MCVVSMVGEFYEHKWWPMIPNTVPNTTFTFPPPVTREEFEILKREVEDMKILLGMAKKYDESTGQKDCEIDEKMEKLRKVAEIVGIDLDDVLKKVER